MYTGWVQLIRKSNRFCFELSRIFELQNNIIFLKNFGLEIDLFLDKIFDLEISLIYLLELRPSLI